MGGLPHPPPRQWPLPLLLTRPAVHCLLQDLQLVVEFGNEGALAERARYEPSLQLVGNVLPGSQLLMVLSRLGQQLQNWDTLALQANDAQGTGTSLQTSKSLQPADCPLCRPEVLTPAMRFPPVFQGQPYI